MHDVLVVGGGPAGLSLAAGAAARGFDVALVERGALPRDKACGEGLMPSGLRVLESLGARARLDPRRCAPITGIHYLQEDGSGVLGALPEGGGLGVRRTELSRVLLDAALRAGAQLLTRTTVHRVRRERARVVLETSLGPLEGRLLVGADGLHSPVRREVGLDGRVRAPRRFGMRRHFALAPWSTFVEVHFSEDAEAYVTPVGVDSVGVAILWDGRLRESGPLRFEALLRRFPGLSARLAGARFDSSVQGAGPFGRGARRAVLDRVVLLGDAAGYVDAITGEGVSLALCASAVLADVLPQALAGGCSAKSLAPYARAHRALFRRYALLATALVAIAQRPRLRRWVLSRLSVTPWGFERLLHSLVPA